ncbi:MAG: polysaccharide biosynthesis tyrosine autokinase [Candidatus Limivicinus sp.]|nr:polysaccharide biosynthesis tyrosine autokinase [Candidatus Limivicinus sp.]
MKNYTYRSDKGTIDFVALLMELKKWIVLMLVVALVFGCAGFAVSDKSTRYSCSFTAMVTSAEPSVSAEAMYYNMSALKNYSKIYAAHLTSSELLSVAAAATEFDVPPVNAQSMVTVSISVDTGFITVTVNAETAADAKHFAENIATLAPEYLAGKIPGCTMQLVNNGEAVALTKDNSGRNVLVGSLVGLFLVAFVVVVRARVLNKVTGREMLEERFCLPVLGCVQNAEGNAKWRMKKPDFGELRLTADSSRSKWDSYCALRTNFMAALKDGANCVGFSCGADQDGKSTSVINLAISLSQIGKRVLLIDADLRTGSASSKLGFADCAGLSQVLSGDHSLDSCVQSISDGLALLPAGELLPTSSDLLSGENAAHLVQNAKNAYDYVLVDLPDIQSAPDAAIAARYTDGILLVVRHDHSRIRQVLEAVRAIDLVDASILGFLYTDAPK